MFQGHIRSYKIAGTPKKSEMQLRRMQVWRVYAEKLVTMVIEALERPPHCSFEKNNSKLVSSLGYQVDFQFSQYKQKLLMVWCVFGIMYLHTIFGLFQLLIVQNRYHLSYSKVLKHIYLNFSLTGFFDFFKNFIYWRNKIHSFLLPSELWTICLHLSYIPFLEHP